MGVESSRNIPCDYEELIHRIHTFLKKYDEEFDKFSNRSLLFRSHFFINEKQKINDIVFFENGREKPYRPLEVQENEMVDAFFDCTVCDSRNDRKLVEFLQSLSKKYEVISLVSELTREELEEKRKELSSSFIKEVIDFYGGLNGKQITKECEQTIKKLKAEKQSNVILLGEVKGCGICRHRSLLFKILCDIHNIPCRILRGWFIYQEQSHAHMWNEIVLKNETLTVDTMNFPCFVEESPHKDQIRLQNLGHPRKRLDYQRKSVEKIRKLYTENRGRNLQRGIHLGSGAFGVVYEIRNIEIFEEEDDEVDDEKRNYKIITTDLAVKEVNILRKSLYGESKSSEHIERIVRREVERMTLLQHPNVVKIIGSFSIKIGKAKTIVRLVMKKYDGSGESLMEHIKENDLTSTPNRSVEVLILLLEIAKGLHYIHSLGIIHFDIKPANILINWNENEEKLKDVVISDFGSSKEEKMNLNLTSKPDITRIFAAPEIIEMIDRKNKPNSNSEETDDSLCVSFTTKSDIYSFGVLMGFFSQFYHDFPGIKEIQKKCLIRKPENRPSISELIQVLRQNLMSEITLLQNKIEHRNIVRNMKLQLEEKKLELERKKSTVINLQKELKEFDQKMKKMIENEKQEYNKKIEQLEKEILQLTENMVEKRENKKKIEQLEKEMEIEKGEHKKKIEKLEKKMENMVEKREYEKKIEQLKNFTKEILQLKRKNEELDKKQKNMVEKREHKKKIEQLEKEIQELKKGKNEEFDFLFQNEEKGEEEEGETEEEDDDDEKKYERVLKSKKQQKKKVEEMKKRMEEELKKMKHGIEKVNIKLQKEQIRRFKERRLELTSKSEGKIDPNLCYGVFTWGDGENGQLGHGNKKEQRIPKLVNKLLPYNNNIQNIFTGEDSFLVLLSNGEVLCWGKNTCCRFGENEDELFVDSPKVIKLPLKRKIMEVKSGPSNTLFLDEKGCVWGCGDNSECFLSDERIEKKKSIPEPILITNEEKGFPKMKKIEIRDNLFCCISDSGRLYIWGKELVDGHKERIPKIVDFFRDIPVKDVTVGVFLILVLTENGKVYSIGDGKYFGRECDKGKPVLMKFLLEDVSIKTISCGNCHAGTIDFIGNCFLWGNNDFGRLGNGVEGGIEKDPCRVEKIIGLDEREIDLDIPLKHKFIGLKCGGHHSFALLEETKENGKVEVHALSWGSSTYGESGIDEVVGNILRPRIVPFFENKNVKRISLGFNFSSSICSFDPKSIIEPEDNLLEK